MCCCCTAQHSHTACAPSWSCFSSVLDDGDRQWQPARVSASWRSARALRFRRKAESCVALRSAISGAWPWAGVFPARVRECEWGSSVQSSVSASHQTASRRFLVASGLEGDLGDMRKQGGSERNGEEGREEVKGRERRLLKEESYHAVDRTVPAVISARRGSA
eukprot:2504714-Rhodomonas_salina.5